MIYWFFPVMVLVAGATAISKRESREFSPLLVGLLDSGFLLPWVASLNSERPSLPLLSLFLVSGAWLLLASLLKGKIQVEAFTKIALSWALGFAFLLLPFLDAHWLTWPLKVANGSVVPSLISVASFACGIFLLWGLPPTQVGVIDAGDVWPRDSHIRSTLSFRMTLVYSLFVCLPSYAEKIPSGMLQTVAAFCFIGLGLSRLVAGVQLSVQRSLSYLSQGMLLPIVMLLGTATIPSSFQNYAALLALFQALIWGSVYAGYQLSESPKHMCWDDPEARLLGYLKRMPGRLRSILHMESIIALLYCGTLAYFGHYRLLLPGLFFVLASQSVALDEHAFAGRGQNSVT